MVIRRNLCDLLNEFDKEFFKQVQPVTKKASYIGEYPWGLPTGITGTQIVPSTSYYYHSARPLVDIKEDNEHVIVEIEVPGVKKNDIKVKLVDPKTLDFVYEYDITSEKGDANTSYHVRERSCGYMKRVLTLPKDVTELDVKTKFENGVLTLIFNKLKIENKDYIQIE